MVQKVKCLLLKPENLSSNTHYLLKMLGIAMCLCCLGPGELGIGKLLELPDQPAHSNA